MGWGSIKDVIGMAQGDVGADKTSRCPGAVAGTLQGREVTHGLSFPWTSQMLLCPAGSKPWHGEN